MIFYYFWNSYFLSYGEFKLREIKLCMQIVQAARRLSRAPHAEPCHWSEGCNNNVGDTAGKASPNASNARGVTAGKMGRNSSNNNACCGPCFSSCIAP